MPTTGALAEPLVLAPIIIPIEVVSYLSRPASHSVRLFAVMLAGHITLKVFAGFVVSLSGFGALGAVRPLMMTVALSLHLHHADLHVSQQRAAPEPLR